MDRLTEVLHALLNVRWGGIYSEIKNGMTGALGVTIMGLICYFSLYYSNSYSKLIYQKQGVQPPFLHARYHLQFMQNSCIHYAKISTSFLFGFI